jgi:hypothetical protein
MYYAVNLKLHTNRQFLEVYNIYQLQKEILYSELGLLVNSWIEAKRDCIEFQ